MQSMQQLKTSPRASSFAVVFHSIRHIPEVRLLRYFSSLLETCVSQQNSPADNQKFSKQPPSKKKPLSNFGQDTQAPGPLFDHCPINTD